MSTIPDSWKLILTPAQIKVGLNRCARFINEHFANTPIILVCILKGAVFFHVDLSRLLTIPHSHYFIEASSYHNKQTQSEEVQILSQINPEKFQGRHVILIDELFDNGTTMRNIKTIIHQRAKVDLNKIFTCTVFKKRKVPVPISADPNQHLIPSIDSISSLDLYGIEVPDVWLVGYGLDDQHEKRELTGLWACPKAPGVPESIDDKIFEDEVAYRELLRSLDKQLFSPITLVPYFFE